MTDHVLPDTNVLGEIWHPRGRQAVKDAFASVAERVVMSVVVLGETWRGIRQLAPSARRDRLEAFHRGIVRDHGDAIIPVTLPVAEAWGEMTARLRGEGRVLHPADGLIAATALVHDLTLWTRNTKDFEGLGVAVFNPWEDRP
jgi:predicted nucleic acid-binding protein